MQTTCFLGECDAGPCLQARLRCRRLSDSMSFPRARRAAAYGCSAVMRRGSLHRRTRSWQVRSQLAGTVPGWRGLHPAAEIAEGRAAVGAAGPVTPAAHAGSCSAERTWVGMGPLRHGRALNGRACCSLRARAAAATSTGVAPWQRCNALVCRRRGAVPSGSRLLRFSRLLACVAPTAARAITVLWLMAWPEDAPWSSASGAAADTSIARVCANPSAWANQRFAIAVVTMERGKLWLAPLAVGTTTTPRFLLRLPAATCGCCLLLSCALLSARV
jgi:hypothetical protein